MGKSILVIDTPEKCNKCPMFTINSGTLDTFCVGFVGIRKQIGNYTPKGIQKPSWCPLRDIPERYGTVSMGFERGYNACIEAIIGENV